MWKNLDRCLFGEPYRLLCKPTKPPMNDEDLLLSDAKKKAPLAPFLFAAQLNYKLNRE